MSLRSFLTSHFGKPVDNSPHGFTDADDLYLSEMVRRAGRLPTFADAILIELNPEYAEIARRRLHSDAGMFAEIAA